MSELPDNLEIWRKVCETPPEHAKLVTLGKRKWTAVDPQYQLRRATELWGPYGIDWKVDCCQWSMVEATETLKPSMILDALFVFPGGSFEVSADMPYRPNDDCRKKLLTAVRSKALSLLGFNADVFLGKYDDERYVSEMQTKFSDEDELREKVLGSIRRASSLQTLEKAKERLDLLRGNNAINKSFYDEGLQALEQQRRELTEVNGAPSPAEQEDIRQQELAELG